MAEHLHQHPQQPAVPPHPEAAGTAEAQNDDLPPCDEGEQLQLFHEALAEGEAQGATAALR